MTIKSIRIKNYRSIKELELNIEEIDNKKCSILLGKNESGKSNILKALSFIDDNVKQNFDYNVDCNKDGKKSEENIEVTFALNFDKTFFETEFKKYEKIPTELITEFKKYENIPTELIKVNQIEKIIRLGINNKIARFFRIDLDESRDYSKYLIDNYDNIVISTEIYNGEEALTNNNIETLLPKYRFLTKKILEEIIRIQSYSLLDYKTPKVIFWQHSNEYLINEPINLLNFMDNTSRSIPLRNIFYVASIEEEKIKTRITQAEKDEEYRLELAEVLSEKITHYINRVWKEHKINIKISIESNMQCYVNIEDQDNHRPKYKMNQRSDGFKQFISILLNLSAANEANILKNKLILLDEPEVHLHPSGIKYLRDELLEMSTNNTLFISTHSVNMVDRLNLSRHYKITKEKSETISYQIQDNNPYEEEVIYDSLGTSIFEHISPNMIIFEGKTDKDLFDEFSKKFKTELNIKNISSISANGVDSIPKYIKFFDGKLVKGFVVVDSDRAGRKVKKQIENENELFDETNTFEINDMVQFNKDTTLEDLLPKGIIETILNEDFKLEIDLDTNKPFMEQIKTIQKSLNEKELKMNILKSVTIDIHKKQMTKEKIKEKYSLYYQFIKSLYGKINS